MCLIYGGWLGIYVAPGMPAVTFHIIIFVFPLLIADKPWRTDLVIITFSTVFIICSYTTKTSDIFHIEFMNAMNSMVLSLIISTIRQIQNVQNFTDRLMLKKQRDTDILSKTLSRQALEAGIKTQLERRDSGGCLMFVDLDNFKHVNDTYGHVVGDNCYRSVP